MYARSVSDPNGFWAEKAKRIGWIKPFTKVENVSFAPGNISIKWFEDGVLNVAWNCVDRHLDKRGGQTAIIWEGDDPSQSKHITYRQLHDEVCKMDSFQGHRLKSCLRFEPSNRQDPEALGGHPEVFLTGSNGKPSNFRLSAIQTSDSGGGSPAPDVGSP